MLTSGHDPQGRHLLKLLIVLGRLPEHWLSILIGKEIWNGLIDGHCFDDGMQIEASDGQSLNADVSILVGAAPDSKVTCESDRHSAKHRPPSSFTDDGRTIAESDVQPQNAAG
jgi:hypothetical protein